MEIKRQLSDREKERKKEMTDGDEVVRDKGKEKQKQRKMG